MTTDYSNLTITVPARWADTVGDLVAELGSLGAQILGDDPVTYVAYFEGGDALDAVERVVRVRLRDAGIADGDVEIASQVVPDTDWEAAWRATLAPVRVGRTWLIHPSWQTPDAVYRRAIVVDPKMAFGTGTHATTQLCLVEMEDLVRSGDSVLDIGTGTGILAMACVLLGARPVLGIEVDPVAIDCARENLTLNGLDESVELLTGRLDDAPPRAYDLIVANIEFRTLTAIAAELRSRIAPGGRALLSGILEIERDRFLDEIRNRGWRVLRARRQYDPMTDDAWISVVASPAA